MIGVKEYCMLEVLTPVENQFGKTYTNNCFVKTCQRILKGNQFNLCCKFKSKFNSSHFKVTCQGKTNRKNND